MKVTVTLDLDLDVDRWADNYGHGRTAIGLTDAIKQALANLRNVDTWTDALHVAGQSMDPNLVWTDLVTVKAAQAVGKF